MSKLPLFLKAYFWDTKFEELDADRHWFLVTKRVLDRGDTQAIKWVLNTYGMDKIREVVSSSIDLSVPTAQFWSGVLDLSKEEVPCLNKPYYSRIPWGLAS